MLGEGEADWSGWVGVDLWRDRAGRLDVVGRTDSRCSTPVLEGSGRLDVTSAGRDMDFSFDYKSGK